MMKLSARNGCMLLCAPSPPVSFVSCRYPYPELVPIPLAVPAKLITGRVNSFAPIVCLCFGNSLTVLDNGFRKTVRFGAAPGDTVDVSIEYYEEI